MYAKRDSVVVSKLCLLKDSMYKMLRKKRKDRKRKGKRGKWKTKKRKGNRKKIGLLGETQTRLERYI